MKGSKMGDYDDPLKQHAYIGFLALLELLLESGPPGPKRVPHGRPVKQTNKRTPSSVKS